MICLVFVLFVAVLVCIRTRALRARARRAAGVEVELTGLTRPRTFDPSRLPVLTVQAVAASDDPRAASEGWEICVICLAQPTEGELLRMLPCGHHFHKSCVDEWFNRGKTSCPLCLRKVDGDSATPAL